MMRQVVVAAAAVAVAAAGLKRDVHVGIVRMTSRKMCDDMLLRRIGSPKYSWMCLHFRLLCYAVDQCHPNHNSSSGSSNTNAPGK